MSSLQYQAEPPIRYVTELPAVLQELPEGVKTRLNLIANRNLALANHANAGLALATWLHIMLLLDPLAETDLMIEYHAWLQMLKSLRGLILQTALQRQQVGVAVPAPSTAPLPEKKSWWRGIIDRVSGR